MRKVLAIKEGVLLPDRRVLDEGSLHLGDATRVPITWAHDNLQGTPIGWASDMQREVDGEITFDMVLRDSEIDLDAYDAYLYATDIDEREIAPDDPMGSEKLVLSARIRVVQLVPIPSIAFKNA